jgi:hypothetical protein
LLISYQVNDIFWCYESYVVFQLVLFNKNGKLRGRWEGGDWRGDGGTEREEVTREGEGKLRALVMYV